MLIYLCIILIAIAIIIFANFVNGYYDLLHILALIGFDILAVFILDALIAIFVRLLPNKWFNFKSKGFKILKFEKKVYDFMKIKKWKEKIPEIGHFTKFRKNKIDDPYNNEYVERYLMECCYGEAIHFISIILGFLIIPFSMILFDYYPECVFYGIIIGIGNGIISFLSFAILRYNRPKLTVIYERNRRLELRNKSSEQAEILNK